jgi:DNA-binding transcriptional LysR family regulator
VAEELHFARAAERLQINASRVSQLIRELEAKLGYQLFERTSRRVRLSALGRQLQTEVGPAYRGLLRKLAFVRESARGVAGVIRLGMYTPINGGPYMLEIIRTFESRHPDCKVALIDTGWARDQLDWLRDDDADVLALRLPVNSPDVAVGPILSREPRVLAVAIDHPLATRDSVSLEDLVPYTVPDVPSLPPEMMELLMPPRTAGGQRFKRVQLRSISEAMMRVASRETVHPTVPSFVTYHRHPGVTAIPIRDLPNSETALVWLATNRSPKVQAFVGAAQVVLAEHNLAEPPDAGMPRPS